MATPGETLENIIESQPPGSIGPRIVKFSGALALVHSVVTKNPNALKAFALGVAGGATGNSLNSLIGHRQAAHKSITVRPGAVNESLRLATGMLGGIKMRAVAMHRRHHDTVDTADDPTAPSQLGRGRVFRDIIGISRRFEKEHPDYTQAVLDESGYTRVRPYENTPFFISSVFTAHMAAGKRLNLPVPYRLASAGLHLSLIYTQNAMFTADVHPEDDSGKIRTFPHGRAMNIVFGSENGHETHHLDPSNPQHSEFDLVYGAARVMRSLGIAEMPYLDKSETN